MKARPRTDLMETLLMERMESRTSASLQTAWCLGEAEGVKASDAMRCAVPEIGSKTGTVRRSCGTNALRGRDRTCGHLITSFCPLPFLPSPSLLSFLCPLFVFFFFCFSVSIYLSSLRFSPSLARSLFYPLWSSSACTHSFLSSGL